MNQMMKKVLEILNILPQRNFLLTKTPSIPKVKHMSYIPTVSYAHTTARFYHTIMTPRLLRILQLVYYTKCKKVNIRLSARHQ